MHKKTILFYLSITIVRIATKIAKLLGRNATHFPGWLALRIYPNFLKYLDKPEKIVFITGTNGKTTVSNLISSVLKDYDYEFVNNGEGSNIAEGIVTALLSKSTFFGKAKVPLAILEVDERCSPLVYPHMAPDYLVCTNLFRDSYRRNAHVQFIWNILNKEIPSKTKLILNGEDLISSQLAKDNNRCYFGISASEGQSSSNNIIKDIATCPKCGALLKYDYIRYNHIGHAHCPNCDFKSPELDYIIEKMDVVNSTCVVRTPNGSFETKLIGKNITDAYNMIAVIALLTELGLTQEQIQSSLSKHKVVATRFDSAVVNGKEVTMILSKGQNPIACSRVCDFIRQQPENKTIILMLDDYYDAKESSENIAWIHDIDFEFLVDTAIEKIIVVGVRHHDYRLRLLMAGIEDNKIICCDNESEISTFIDESKIEKIIIMYDNAIVRKARQVYEEMKNKLSNSN